MRPRASLLARIHPHFIGFDWTLSNIQNNLMIIKMSGKDRLRRFCLLLSYCGKNYHGMQRNPGINSVEENLLKALRDSGMIPEEQYFRPQLMYFQRAARTDKSVSAIKQIVSLKIRESILNNLDNINEKLPSDIRLMGAKRVIATFDAKNHCDARTYSYLMPSFALCPVEQVTQENYKVDKDVLKLFNETLQGYVGTHIFHNFTSGKAFKDDSASRVIRFMYCSEPFHPCNQKEIEFVVVRIKGQSFMMHQIRKMIGLAIAVVKGFATEEHIKKALEESYMDVPKAPGLGLMLEEVHFDRYNRRYGGDGHHEPIEWEAQNEAIEKFKNEFIYPVVVETELTEKSMFNWLKTLSLHSYGGSNPEKQPEDLKDTQKSHGSPTEDLESESKLSEDSHPAKRLKSDNEAQEKPCDKSQASDSLTTSVEAT